MSYRTLSIINIFRMFLETLRKNKIEILIENLRIFFKLDLLKNLIKIFYLNLKFQ